jgi:hypothetical protein
MGWKAVCGAEVQTTGATWRVRAPRCVAGASGTVAEKSALTKRFAELKFTR